MPASFAIAKPDMNESGSVVVCGKVKNKGDLRALPISLRNELLESDISTTLRIDSAGEFCGEIALGHAVVGFVEPNIGWLLLMPGDTVRLDIDMNEHRMDILGPSAAALYDSLRTCNEKRHESWVRYKHAHVVRESVDAGEYVRTLCSLLDSLLADFNVPVEPDPYRETARQTAALYSITDVIENILDMELYHKEKRYIQIDAKTFRENPDFVPLDMMPLYSVFGRYAELTVDNPALLLYNSQALHILNRLQYSLYFNMCSDDADLDDVLAKIEEKTGISANSLLSRIVKSRFIHKRAEETQPQTMLAVPESLAEIIAPYRGKRLFVDFWGMGCGPCRHAMLQQRDAVELIAQKHATDNAVVYVTYDREDECSPWLTENRIGGEHVFVSANLWALLQGELQFGGIPFSVVVEPDGKTYRVAEARSSSELLDELGITLGD